MIYRLITYRSLWRNFISFHLLCGFQIKNCNSEHSHKINFAKSEFYITNKIITLTNEDLNKEHFLHKERNSVLIWYVIQEQSVLVFYGKTIL